MGCPWERIGVMGAATAAAAGTEVVAGTSVTAAAAGTSATAGAMTMVWVAVVTAAAR